MWDLCASLSNQPRAPLTIALPDHICLLLFGHTRRKHSRVAFVHCVCDLVREQVGCGVDGGWGQRLRASGWMEGGVRGQGQSLFSLLTFGPDSPPGLLCT